MQEIDFFITASTQPWEKNYAKELGKAFEHKGFHSRMIDIAGGDFRSYLIGCIEKKPALTITFDLNALVIQDSFLWENIGAKVLLYGLRTPLEAWTISKRSKGATLGVVDQNLYDSFSCNSSENILFLPLALSKEQILTQRDPIYEITFFANYVDSEEEKASWSDLYSQEVFEMLEKASEICLSSKEHSCLSALEEARRILDIDPLGIFLPSLYYTLHTYCTAKEQLSLLKSLYPLKTDLFGGQKGIKGWKKVMRELSHVTLHGPISYEETKEIAARSKMVLNSSPALRFGLHDRILSGVAGGALPITSESSYLKNIFGDSLLYYTPGKAIDTHEIGHLLQDSKERRSRNEQAREILLHSHTWDNRAETLCKKLIY